MEVLAQRQWRGAGGMREATFCLLICRLHAGPWWGREKSFVLKPKVRGVWWKGHLPASNNLQFPVYLVVFVCVTKEVPEEVEMGALPDEDEVGGAVGEVSGGRQAFGTAGTRTAHTGGVDGDKLSVDHPPTVAAIWKRWSRVKHLIACL